MSLYSAVFALPKVWRKESVIALLKPHKAPSDSNSNRRISLLCVPYRLLERPVLARLEPLIDQLLPHTQAGFRRGLYAPLTK